MKPNEVCVESEAVFEALLEHADLIVALGHEGKQEVRIDSDKRPLSAAMAENSNRSSRKKHIGGASGYPSRSMAG